MKKISILFLSLCALLVSCGGEEVALEKMIPAANVDISGAHANAIKLAGDIKIFMVPDEKSSGRWTIRALAPMECATKMPDDVTSFQQTDLDLVDANYSEINKYFGMRVQNDEQLLTLLKSEPGTLKNIAFEPLWANISYDDYEAICKIVNSTERISMVLECNIPYSSSCCRPHQGYRS